MDGFSLKNIITIVVTAAGFALMIIWYNAWYLPERNIIEALKQEKKIQFQDFSHISITDEALDSLRHEYERLAGIPPEIRERCIPLDSVLFLTALIGKNIRENNVDLIGRMITRTGDNSIDYGSLEAVDSSDSSLVIPVDIEIPIRGDYTNLLGFIRSLPSLPHLPPWRGTALRMATGDSLYPEIDAMIVVRIMAIRLQTNTPEQFSQPRQGGAMGSEFSTNITGNWNANKPLVSGNAEIVNPFFRAEIRPAKRDGRRETNPPPPLAGLNFRGAAVYGNRKIVFINDGLYEVGDMVADLTVAVILADRVLLRDRNGALHTLK